MLAANLFQDLRGAKMQDDLISRRAALDVLSYCGEITVREAREEIMALPAVDAEPVRYGCEYCSGDSTDEEILKFVEEYLGITLYPHQRLILKFLWRKNKCGWLMRMKF